MNALDLFELVKEEFTRPSINKGYPGLCSVIYALFEERVISRNDRRFFNKVVDEEGYIKEGSYSLLGGYYPKNVGEYCGGYLWKPYTKEPRIEFLDKKISEYSCLT